MKSKNILTKDNKFEPYALLFVSLCCLVLAILLYMGVLTIKEDSLINGNEKIFTIILFVFSIGFAGFSIFKIIKDLKKKKSVLYLFHKVENDDYIKSKLEILGADTLSIDTTYKHIYCIEVDYEKATFCCDVHEDEVLFYVECKDWYYDSLEEVEQEKIDNFSDKMNALEVSIDDVINKFINFVLRYKDEI